jgi:hypothetical protein
MSSTPGSAPVVPVQLSREWRQDIVTRQLDDVNVLGEALVAALSDKDEVRVATLRASLERYALAMSWSRDKFLPAVLAYAREQPEFDDDFFAPAFILKSIAPDQPETASLLARASQNARDLLARL